MRTKILIVVLVIALVVTAGLVMAQGMKGGKKAAGGGCGMGLGMGFGPKIMKELNLTSDQRQQMKTLRTEFMTSTQAARDQMQTKAQELAQLWAQDAGASQLKAKLAEIDTLRAEIRDAGVDFALKARTLLTEEQRTKLQEMIKSTPGCGAGLCGGLGMGCGLGMGDGTGPAAAAGTCPMMNTSPADDDSE
ncbi:MAG: periplasmic heavy metal sensor [Armatimonadota bacterium]|nr:periplasmic heavy metal sensor [bacterium]